MLVVLSLSRSLSHVRHNHGAERQSAAKQCEGGRVRTFLPKESIEPAPGEHADQ